MDGYTYENPTGGWSVCQICGGRVSDEEEHTKFHQALTNALISIQHGWHPSFAWNTPPATPKENHQ
jgi:hypothetical protein